MIIVEITSHSVHLVLVDSGSLINILNKTTCDYMDFLNNQLRLSSISLYGFVREHVISESYIELLLTIGT